MLANDQIADLLCPLDVAPGIQPPTLMPFPNGGEQAVTLPLPQRLGGNPHQTAGDGNSEDGVGRLLGMWLLHGEPPDGYLTQLEYQEATRLRNSRPEPRKWQGFP